VAEEHVDARGLACPQPVLMTRKAMQTSGVDCVRVVVDSDVPAENIQRLANSQGWVPQVDNKGGEIHLTLRRADAAGTPGTATAGQTPARTAPEERTVVVFVTSNQFGQGDEKLGEILMRSFVKTLHELEPLPREIIFANSGVRLTSAGSDLVADLQRLEERGVAIRSCGTCLDFYNLIDSLEVGTATNMYEILTSLARADRVVRP
jgi:selenium metabolism protein YedF